MQKNILVLNYEFPPIGGGGSPVSYDIAKQYVELGYRVDVITMSFKGLKSYETQDGIHIHRVKSLRTKKQVCHPWEQLTYLFSGYFKAKQLLKKRNYDICHCHFIIPTGALAMKLKKKFGLNYIVTTHGSDVLGHNPRFKKLYPILKNSWIKIIDNAQAIISPSKYLNDKIEDIYGKNKKLIVIPNGIEKDKFKPLKKQKYILCVARLVYAKGIQDLIEAVKNIELGDWKIKIVGEGPIKPELEELVQQYSLQKNIEFLGWVDNKSDQMKKLYGHASVFCQPSHFENMSIVLLEAMQAGCHIIANDVGGNKEVVGKQGVYIKDDIIELRNNIKKAIKGDFNTYDIEKYHWKNIIKKYLKVL